MSVHLKKVTMIAIAMFTGGFRLYCNKIITINNQSVRCRVFSKNSSSRRKV